VIAQISTAMTTTNTQPDAISGDLLDALLDRADALIEGDRDDESASGDLPLNEQLATLLGSRECQPSTMEALHRLYRLWLQAGKPQQALAALAAHSNSVLSALPEDERADAKVSHTLWTLDALESAGEKSALKAQLEKTATLLKSATEHARLDDAWGYVCRVAQDAGEHEIMRNGVLERHALVSRDPDRSRYRAWDESVKLLRLARSYKVEERESEAKEHAQRALKALLDATPDQDIDADDWINFGDTIATIDPSSLTHVLNGARMSLPDDTSVGERRDLEVRLARIGAKARYHEKKLVEAIKKSHEGRYYLTRDSDDSFSALVLDWHLEAQDEAAAAALAFECIFYERPYSSGYAISVVEKKFADGFPHHPLWTLSRAAAAMENDYSEYLSGEDEAAFIERHIKHAESSGQTLPEVAAIRGVYLAKHQKNLVGALPHLEAAVTYGHMRSPDVIEQLWLARVHRLGLDAAIRSEPPLCASASWNYALGVWLTGGFDEELPENISISDEMGYKLATRYYEAAIVGFETFFTGKQGHYKDADIHTYSMLCNNLGIAYRYYENQPERALPLHQKGIATSSFAEHYNGIVSCYHQMEGKDAEYLIAADELWNYANEYGYSRHDPSGYFGNVALALRNLGRDKEIAIWLQRAQEWWQGMDPEDQAENRHDYLAAQTDTLRYLAFSQPQDAVARMDFILMDARAQNTSRMFRISGYVYENAGLPDRALPLFKEALHCLDTNPKDGVENEREWITEAIARCKGGSNSGKAWWKIW
jgi:cellulose synthase operon protein C